MMYSVMLVDNEPIIPKGLMKLIDWRSCDCQISAVARDGIDAVRQIREQAPDILITGHPHAGNGRLAAVRLGA